MNSPSETNIEELEFEKRLQYYANVSRFSNVRTYLNILIRTCAVFVGLAIYLKSKYVFLLVLVIVFFGTFEYLLLNKKLGEDQLTVSYSAYYNIVLIYGILFLVIFLFLFYKPPF